MTGTLILTPDELAELVAAVMIYNGYHAGDLALFKTGVLVDYDQVVITIDAAPLKIRTQPEDQGMAARLRASYAQAASGNGT